MRITNKFIFFFTEKDVFSNWHISSFIEPLASNFDPFCDNNIEFACVEQYMMWRKALIFGDFRIADAILSHSFQYHNEKPQAYYKRMGRKVKGYEDRDWIVWRESVVKRGLLLKYTQNQDLKDELFKYKDKQFVEASPYDAIYGIKMGMWDEGVEDSTNWKGENLLGKWHNDLVKHFTKENK